MSGFIYKGFSTEDILDSSELVLASTIGAVDVTPQITRTLQGGEPTISRPIVNEYGVIPQHLEFNYSLMKVNHDFFTESEQRVIDRWLSSPQYSSTLIVYDCNKTLKYKYYGKFTGMEWVANSQGYIAANFTFSVNGSYAYETYVLEFEPGTVEDLITGETDYEEDWSFDLDCTSDETEEWVYPMLTVQNLTGDKDYTFSIKNNTDMSKEMSVKFTVASGNMYFDCRHCIITDDSGAVDYQAMGWDDVGNIYWLRFIPGINNIVVHGKVKLGIVYDSPVKIAGGWLV